MTRPTATDPDDGRHVDERRGALAGEAASVKVMHPEQAFPLGDEVVLPPASPELERHPSGYFSLPALKSPVWKGFIPLYFYVGGVAGSAATLAAAASLRGPRLRPLTRHARWLAVGSTALSAGLLVADLGRPSRFLHMLRVLRPTSPMSVGTWIVTPLGALIGIAALAGRSRGALGRLGDAAGLASGLLGIPMSSYTAVLLANTAVPVWTEARRSLPWLFAASSISSAGALLELLPRRAGERDVLRRFSIAGRVGELVAAKSMERELGRSRAARPLHHGTSGRLWTSAKVLGLASIVLALGSRRSPVARVLGSAAATAAAMCLRLSITKAGDASSRDPEASLLRERTRSRARSAPGGRHGSLV